MLSQHNDAPKFLPENSSANLIGGILEKGKILNLWSGGKANKKNIRLPKGVALVIAANDNSSCVAHFPTGERWVLNQDGTLKYLEPEMPHRGLAMEISAGEDGIPHTRTTGHNRGRWGFTHNCRYGDWSPCGGYGTSHFAGNHMDDQIFIAIDQTDLAKVLNLEFTDYTGANWEKGLDTVPYLILSALKRVLG